MTDIHDRNKLMIIEENAIEAYLEWRIQIGKGEMNFEITVTDQNQEKEFEDMLKRHNHRYRKRDKSYYL